jgi:predicted Zn-dependent protease
MVVSKEFRAFADEADIAMQLLFLKYSRDHESQSDQLGVEYSTKVGYDAREMADFFKTLKSLGTQEDGSQIPTFLSTHPDPQDRYEKVGLAATDWQAKVATPPYKINRDAYLKMVDGIVYGEDPRQGYVDNSTFYHPELKFFYPVPANWKLVNSPTQVQMAPEDGKALMLLTLAQGSTLQAAAAKDTADLHLIVTGSKQVTINGFQALEVQSKQVSQDPNTGEKSEIRVQSVYIQYGKLIYVFHGVSTPADFQTYKAAFDKTMYGFKELKDQAKINVVPERIKVVSVKKSGTLGQALLYYGIMTRRHRELGIVNGKDLTDPVAQGDLIKIVVK